MQHLLSLFDISESDLKQILATASHLKSGLARGERPPVLERRVLALLFEKPSLRTRVSLKQGSLNWEDPVSFSERMLDGENVSPPQISHRCLGNLLMPLSAEPSSMSEQPSLQVLMRCR